MKKTLLLLPFFAFLLFSSCEKEDASDPLHVEFTNSSQSGYTIFALEIADAGPAADAVSSSTLGEWSENVLPEGTRLAPGQTVSVDLDIPSGMKAVCRLGVIDGDGQELMLNEQGDVPIMLPTITHWGSDERMVIVEVGYNSSLGVISVYGYTDSAM